MAGLSKQPLWFLGFIGLLILLPLPFGTNRPWLSDLFGAWCGLLTLGAAWHVWRDPSLWLMNAPVRRMRASASLLGLVALWAFLQTQSWMPFHHPLWAMTHSTNGAIALDPDQYAESMIRLLSYVACFLLAFIGGRDGARAQNLLLALSVAAVGYALYGLLMVSTGLEFILWFNKWAYRGFVTSTFVNKNSYATYAGLGFLCCLSLLWQRIKRKPSYNPMEQSLAAVWFEKMLRKDIFYILMSLIVLAAVLMTGSRAGIVSTLLGTFAFLSCLAVNRHWGWKISTPIVVAGLFGFVVLIVLSDSAFLERMNENQLETGALLRGDAYKLMIQAIADRPLLGYGLGGFEGAFRLYRDQSVEAWFQHAHDDYLELAMELGIPAALMLITAILLMVSCCIEGVWKRRRHEVFPILACGATVLIGMHSLADFSMQIPAVAATYAALLGMGVAQSWSSKEKSDL